MSRPSTTPRSRALPRSPPPGGIRAARWACCTSSTRCGSAIIKEAACRRFGRDAKRLDSLAGLRILDIGCGGGILSEPLARLGADVVGADPAAANIEAARLHAAQGDLAIDYRVTTAEALADAGERFDVVLAMEVVEHVADVALFVTRCAEMVKPGGLMIVATLNRTLKSFALAIVGAEYVLGWLPRGTHQWDKFVTPNELEAALERHGLRVVERDRRDLQSARRPLADLDRHGRELHGDGGEGAAVPASCPARRRHPSFSISGSEGRGWPGQARP